VPVMSRPAIDLPRVIGHRGAAAYAPENTLSGIRRAAELGVGWVEVDVALSGGESPVLMHDDTLDRTTDGAGSLAASSDVVIAGLDAGGWFAEQFAGEPVPSFVDALRLCCDLGIGIDVEIKPTPGTDRETAEMAISVLRRVWREDRDRPVAFLTSFSVESLAVALAVAPEIPRGLLVWDKADDWSAADRLGCFAVVANEAIVDADWSRAVGAKGFALACYTVNDPARAAVLRTIGVDCIISDVPDLVS